MKRTEVVTQVGAPVDAREVELRNGIRLATSSGMTGQAKLYREKLKEHLDGIEPGRYIARERGLLGEQFFQKFSLLTVISWRYTLPRLDRTVVGRNVSFAEQNTVHFGFKVELAPGVYVYYPYLCEVNGQARKTGASEAGVDYAGRMVPVAGMELVREAKASGWFGSLHVLDPVDPAEQYAADLKARTESFEKYCEAIKRDPLIFGFGLDNLPYQVYHWIGEDERAMTAEQVTAMVQGLEREVNEPSKDRS